MTQAFNAKAFEKAASEAKASDKVVSAESRKSEEPVSNAKSSQVANGDFRLNKVVSDGEKFVAKLAPLIGLSLLLFLAIVPIFILYEVAFHDNSYTWSYLVKEEVPLLAVSTFAALSFTIGAILYKRWSE